MNFISIKSTSLRVIDAFKFEIVITDEYTKGRRLMYITCCNICINYKGVVAYFTYYMMYQVIPRHPC